LDEDRFNISVRKFLKEVGVTSQREIEKSVREGLDEGTLTVATPVEATMTLTVPELGLTHVVQGTIHLE
jgi:hypothetical protein